MSLVSLTATSVFWSSCCCRNGETYPRGWTAVASRKMSGSENNERDQGDVNSSAPYPPPAPSQYPQPQSSYGYPTGEYPSISDHDLAIGGQGYPQPLQIAPQLQDGAATTRASNGEAMRVNTNGSSGMAPPQPQGTQGFSPPGPRPSVDDTPTSATPVDQKGKRGKASQACDECRRKKVCAS
jgi:hypothetical protein